MGADRARVSYDPGQQYRSVVMQQGRVTLEADWNESQAIQGELIRQETLDIIGPAGTPDNGYEIVVTGAVPVPPFDFTVRAGTMYVGGVRLVLDAAVQYSNQSDWLDNSSDPDWNMPTADNPPTDEYIYLLVREQEVSAVEDSALREVALGGPDTAARTRMIQHIVRLPTTTTDCAGGLTAAEAYWAKEGLIFDPATMRLEPQSTLQVTFGTLPAPDPCEPEVTGGYLGADNQLIRVQITGQNTLVWGFDDASFLYRVAIQPGLQTLKLPVATGRCLPSAPGESGRRSAALRRCAKRRRIRSRSLWSSGLRRNPNPDYVLRPVNPASRIAQSADTSVRRHGGGSAADLPAGLAAATHLHSRNAN